MRSLTWTVAGSSATNSNPGTRCPASTSPGRGVDFKYSTLKTTLPTDAIGTIGQSTSTGLELVMVTSNQVAFASGSKAIRSTLMVTPSTCPEALTLTIPALGGGVPGPDPSTGLAS